MKGWKHKKRNTIVGSDSNPTKFEGGQVIINKRSTAKNLKRLEEINNDGDGKTTTDATKGGLLKGKPHYDKNGNPTGGIPAIVDGTSQIETEGGEYVLSKEASQKHWKELSKINQQGGGVPIKPNDVGLIGDNPDEYKRGGVVFDFNPNDVPKKHIIALATKVKTEYPELWKSTANVYGDEAHKNLKRVSERGYWLDGEEWMYSHWKNYQAKHGNEVKTSGVIALLKWGGSTNGGWEHTRTIIGKAMKKQSKGWKYQKEKRSLGGTTGFENVLWNKIVEDKPHSFAKGGKTIAQTPAPKSDRIYGSDVNKPKSSQSVGSAEAIKFDEKTIQALKNKVAEHNKKYPNKQITLASAKAVMRRGMGAYSKSHRPTIKGGARNSRTAWGLARLNAFTYKIVHGKSKSGRYIQDDDLIQELGYSVKKYDMGGMVECRNCGWEWDIKDSEPHDKYICHKCGCDNEIYANGGLIAPNGQPSNLTPEQYRLVRTPEFKAWFGDWDNDTENSSKIVDENGEPLVVWHGGNIGNYFLQEKIGKNDEGWYGYGYYFTDDKSFAEEWNKNVKPYFLNISKPYRIVKKGITVVNPFYTNSKKYTDEKIKEGYNGSIFNLRTPNEYCVFYPYSQNIKLADGTNTTFDGSNPDIRFDKGGLIPERYRQMGFTKVGEKKNSTLPEKKWMVLAKKGDQYKVVHGGYKGMQDYTQHHDKERRKRFWQRMGGINSEKAKDPFSPLYWHKKFGTWEHGGATELQKGIKFEKEHLGTAQKLYEHQITPEQAARSIAKEHLKEDKKYYTKLTEMERKFASGGEVTIFDIKDGDIVRGIYFKPDIYGNFRVIRVNPNANTFLATNLLTKKQVVLSGGEVTMFLKKATADTAKEQKEVSKKETEKAVQKPSPAPMKKEAEKKTTQIDSENALQLWANKNLMNYKEETSEDVFDKSFQEYNSLATKPPVGEAGVTKLYESAERFLAILNSEYVPSTVTKSEKENLISDVTQKINKYETEYMDAKMAKEKSPLELFSKVAEAKEIKKLIPETSHDSIKILDEIITENSKIIQDKLLFEPTLFFDKYAANIASPMSQKLQTDLTNNERFKAWFNGSKVVDGNGNPLMVYHGTGGLKKEEFDKFSFSPFPAAYFAENKTYADWFSTYRGGNSIMYRVYLRVLNPIDLTPFELRKITYEDFIIYMKYKYGYDLPENKMLMEMSKKMNGMWAWRYLRSGVDWLKFLNKSGEFDGFNYYENNPDDQVGGKENVTKAWMVFEGNQIKSADSVSNTFSLDTDIIKMEEGGTI